MWMLLFNKPFKKLHRHSWCKILHQLLMDEIRHRLKYPDLLEVGTMVSSSLWRLPRSHHETPPENHMRNLGRTRRKPLTQKIDRPCRSGSKENPCKQWYKSPMPCCPSARDKANLRKLRMRNRVRAGFYVVRLLCWIS